MKFVNAKSYCQQILSNTVASEVIRLILYAIKSLRTGVRKRLSRTTGLSRNSGRVYTPTDAIGIEGDTCLYPGYEIERFESEGGTCSITQKEARDAE